MAQLQMLREEVHARALRACQNAKRSKVGAARVLEEGGGGAEELLLIFLVVVFVPVLCTRIPGRKRQPSDDARTAPIVPGLRSKSTALDTHLPPEASY
jgi:hypothetical protein